MRAGGLLNVNSKWTIYRQNDNYTLSLPVFPVVITHYPFLLT